PILHGSSHEGGLRPGTLNVPGIVGLGEAARIAAVEMPTEPARQRALCSRLWQGLCRGLPPLTREGTRATSLPNTLSVSIAGVSVEDLLPQLERICVSTGSACSSGSTRISYVLRAIGLADDLARGTIRFSVGRFTTSAEIDGVVGMV